MKTRALLLALPALALALGGCRDNRASVSIHGICVPPTSQPCAFSGGTCSAFYAGNPAVDAVNSANGLLTIYVEVENQLVDNTNTQQFHTNTNDAHVDEIMVEYQGINLPRVVVGTQQRIPTGGTSVVAVDLVPSGTGPTLAAYAPSATQREMTAVLKLGGYWDDGSRWETGEFPVGVEVCSNCIANCTLTCGNQGALPRSCQ